MILEGVAVVVLESMSLCTADTVQNLQALGPCKMPATYGDMTLLSPHLGRCPLGAPARMELQRSFQYRAPRRSSPRGRMRTVAGRADAAESPSARFGSAASTSC